jgi:hypothetical protein
VGNAYNFDGHGTLRADNVDILYPGLGAFCAKFTKNFWVHVFISGSGDFSIEFWLKPRLPGSHENVFEFRYVDSEQGFKIGIDGDRISAWMGSTQNLKKKRKNFERQKKICTRNKLFSLYF